MRFFSIFIIIVQEIFLFRLLFINYLFLFTRRVRINERFPEQILFKKVFDITRN